MPGPISLSMSGAAPAVRTPPALQGWSGAILAKPAKGVEGVAPGAQLVSVKVTCLFISAPDSPNNSGPSYTSGVLAAISWIGGTVPFQRRRSVWPPQDVPAAVNIGILWAYQSLWPDRYIIPLGSTGRSDPSSLVICQGRVFHLRRQATATNRHAISFRPIGLRNCRRHGG